MKIFFIIFPLFFIGTFTLVIYTLSKRGWADLASNFRYDGAFTGKRIGIISAGINGVNYNNILLCRINTNGLYIKPVFIFRLFHAPILIPLNQIKAVRDKHFLRFSFKEIVVGEPAIAFIQLRVSTFEKIQHMIHTFGAVH